MHAVRAKFDGEHIETPDELRGAAPADVLIVYPAEQPAAQGGSIWDAFGKAPHPRDTDEINAQVRSDRDSWDKR